MFWWGPEKTSADKRKTMILDAGRSWENNFILQYLEEFDSEIRKWLIWAGRVCVWIKPLTDRRKTSFFDQFLMKYVVLSWKFNNFYEKFIRNPMFFFPLWYLQIVDNIFIGKLSRTWHLNVNFCSIRKLFKVQYLITVSMFPFLNFKNCIFSKKEHQISFSWT